jgi:uncharacterized membrane protein
MRQISGTQLRRAIVTCARLAAGGLASTLISTLIAMTTGNAINRAMFHLVFLIVTGVIAMLLGTTGHVECRSNSSFVFVFALCEPVDYFCYTG